MLWSQTMLDDQQILEIISKQRSDVPMNIVKTFTDSRHELILNRRIFKSKLQPVPPSLCFFEKSNHRLDTYSMNSFFDIVDPKYTIVPFGSQRKSIDLAEDMGISYNTFYNDLPLQSYTIAQDNEMNVPGRLSKQTDFFKETGINHGLWSAGHLIAHRYTPHFSDPKFAATVQLKWNFIPEPHYWNCHQRNHLERQSLDGYYGIYPIYTLRFIHGRTVNNFKGNSIKLAYRPIPDGEFFVSDNYNGNITSIFMPFVDNATKVYNSDTSTRSNNKLVEVVAQHRVNATARPRKLIINFHIELGDLAARLNADKLENERIALAQQNLFTDGINNVLHQSAVIRQERAATIEFNTPSNKMQCALIFSALGNRKKEKLYLKATKQHANILLEECEGEDSKTKIFTDRQFKEFKQTFNEHGSLLDTLNRLAFHHT